MANCLSISNVLLNYDYRHSDSSQIAGSLGNIAILFRKAGNFPKAIYCLQESIKINEIHGRKELANNYSNLANVYSDINQDEKARDFFFKTLKIRLEQNDEKGMAISYSNLANYFSNVAIFSSNTSSFPLVPSCSCFTLFAMGLM